MRRFSMLLLLAAACSETTVGGGADCTDNADCRAGFVCLDGVCTGICTTSDDCATGTCCDDGVCMPCDVQPPVIAAVDGTGSVDLDSTHTDRHLRGELVITGENLASASAALIGEGQSWDLALCAAATDTEMRVRLPDAVVAGDFLLTLVNQGGSCSADLRLLQGEPGSLEASGSEIVASINTAMAADSGLSVTRAGAVACTGCIGSGEIEDGSVGNADLSLSPPFEVGALAVTAGGVGVGTPEPYGVFEVSAGYTYDYVGESGASTEPCPCDQSSSAFDCGGVGASFTVGTYHSPECIDVGTGATHYYQTTDSPSIVVADDGGVSISGLGIEIVSDNIYQAQWDGSESIAVDCPTGKRVIGGGCHCSRSNAENCNLSRNYPPNDTSWHCRAQSSTTSNLTLTVYAICANAW